MKLKTIGWDVGGANLKAVLLDENNKVLAAIQLACPLWQGLDQLEDAINQVLQSFAQPEARHVATMTGELVDIFANRSDGVIQISTCLREQLGPNLILYAGSSGFVGIDDVERYIPQIASANWYLSARYAANVFSDGLMIDIGSTTTDLIPFRASKPINQGTTDAERMRLSELVYTGVTRTPLMALTQSIAFRGQKYGVAAEYFATTADIYRLTDELAASNDMAATADGAEKSAEASMRRLARMIGHDQEDAADTDWIELAHTFRECQLEQLEKAINKVLSHAQITAIAPFVGAGSGSFLVKALAQRFNRPYMQIDSVIDAEKEEAKHWAGICLPAYCAAYLMPK
ncbi:MAG: hydantoinase/oxoprolinase family protein [Methylophilaceae bacterium]|nr:hydantoinase/oxoprolinase family protein [Methylophilaceae bacterium]